MENEEADMNPDEAAAALARIDRTQTRLAERAHWPLYRHALFGLVEGLIVAGLAQPVAQAGAMIVAALVLIVICIGWDRRRDGMFVSGWQPGATRTLTVVITLFVLAMAVTSVTLRDSGAAVPIGYLLGGITLVVCTAASLHWEKLYRDHLVGKATA